MLWWIAGVVAVSLAIVAAVAWRRGGSSRSGFDAARTTAQLARVAPATASVTVVKEEGGIRRETRVGRAALLSRDGQLLHRGKRFYIGRPEGLGDGEADAIRGRGEAVTLDMRHRGTRYTLAGVVVGRRRLSRVRRRQLDVPTDVCFAVVPRGSLVRKQDRKAVRYCLAASPEEGEQPCTHLALDAYAYCVAAPADEGPSGEEPRTEARLVPWRGSGQLKIPSNPADAVATVEGDLDHLPPQERWFWLAQWTPDGTLASRGRWRAAGSTGEGRQLQLSRLEEYGGEPPADDSEPLLLGYRTGERWRVLTASLVASGDAQCVAAPRSLPTTERGLALEVLDFSLTGLRAAVSPEAVAFLFGATAEEDGAEENAEARRERLAALKGTEVGLGLYPRFLFPPHAAELVPNVAGNAHLLTEVLRVESVDDGPDSLVHLGLEYTWEPASYDPATGLPAAWRGLMEGRDSAFFAPIHRALNQLSGQLERDMPLSGTAAAEQ